MSWIEHLLAGPDVARTLSELLGLEELVLGASAEAVAIIRMSVHADRCSAEVLDSVLHRVLHREGDLIDPLLGAELPGQDFPGSLGCCGGLRKKLPPCFGGWLGDSGSLTDLLCHSSFVPS